MQHPNITGPIWIVAGTRPEVIKLAPVYGRARERLGDETVQWISTGQHMDLETETLRRFGITPKHRLPPRNSPSSLLDFDETTIHELTRLQEHERPSLVIVQGDTASTFAGAFAAFHAGIPVAHVEAGLRTGDIHDPYPEESYRRMTDAMADLHFAPTPWAADNLRREGYAEASILCTGNTAIDALSMTDVPGAAAPAPAALKLPDTGRILFVTLHRRESWGQPLEDLCRAIRDIVLNYGDLHLILPLHVNPVVRNTVTTVLGDLPRVTLTPPLDFVACHQVISRSYLIMTDSGGIAEEAPSYHVPTLILRKTTERPEAAQQGLAELTGTDRHEVFAAACRILDDPVLHARMQGMRNPYGDGHAAERIALGVERYLTGVSPILTSDEQFA